MRRHHNDPLGTLGLLIVAWWLLVFLAGCADAEQTTTRHIPCRMLGQKCRSDVDCCARYVCWPGLDDTPENRHRFPYYDWDEPGECSLVTLTPFPTPRNETR